MQVIERDLITDGQIDVRQGEGDTGHSLSEQLIGASAWAEAARAAVEQFAGHDRPVLLEGEQGTGKRLLARLIHDRSARGNRVFVGLSLQQGTAELFEKVFYGMGGDSVQSGLVESVRGGTLYLNVVPPLTPSLQASVTRLIASQAGLGMGGTRIILGVTKVLHAGDAASPLADACGIRDIFRALPLRERVSDIEPLSRHFVKEFCRQSGREMREIDATALAKLLSHEWTGNVGELKAAMHQMVEKSGPPRIEASLFPSRMVNVFTMKECSIPEAGIDLSKEVRQFEQSLLCAALKQSRGVQLKAAQLLNIKPTTLNMKLSRYGIDVSWFK